jgi:hypothetical protein
MQSRYYDSMNDKGILLSGALAGPFRGGKCSLTTLARAHTTLGTSAGIIGNPHVLGARTPLNRAAKYAIAAGAPLTAKLMCSLATSW